MNSKAKLQIVEVTVNSKEENSLDLCLDFVKEFNLRIACLTDSYLEQDIMSLVLIHISHKRQHLAHIDNHLKHT